MENQIFEAAERLADKLDVPSGAVIAAAGLVVLARQDGADELSGEICGREVRLPWRAPLSAIAGQVATVPGAAGPVVAVTAGGRTLVADLGAGSVEAEPLLRGHLAAALAADPEQPAGRAWLWSDEDERVVAGAHAGRSWDTDRTVASMIREHMVSRPDAVAIEHEDRTVTYRQLGELTSAIAAGFARAGVGRGDLVGIGLPRRIETIAALLATWSLGAGFLPLDPTHPPLRLSRQLETAGAAHAVLPPGADVPGCAMLTLDTVPATPGTPPGTDASGAGGPLGADVPASGAAGAPPGFPVELGGVAYALSTSGSTGTPKAVAIPHAALRHCVGAIAHLIGADRPHVTCMATLTFDMSTMEIFLPLATGGRLLLVDEDLQRDPERLAARLSGRRLDLVQATPTTWRMTVPYLEPGSLAGADVIAGGEALGATLVAALQRTGARVWNGYGPTETTIYTVLHRVPDPPADPVPIGRPLPGIRAAVLDRWDRAAPVGQIGELVLSGPQLALGYIGDAARTAAVFQEHPELGRVYRTGDLCAWRPDGTLAYHGRVDHQVKLRGQRIELEEIEAVAERHPQVVRAAAVVVEHGANDKRLVLYAQADSTRGAELREHLEQWLPRALMPQHVVILPALPLTGSQKIDRTALQVHAGTLMEAR
ncbi:amino acid adenylation domain-containing protein [Nonomuraea sp. NPDC048826]|uniref:amino acid adenylation domain-containing protein n=1 Tax=Nonomuraea sp. NPDC048826 TaxID=3364347 RepID=UPI00371D5ACE